MTGNGRSSGARMLRELRQRRGMSWSDQARALRDAARALGLSNLVRTTVPSIQRNIARWESQEAPVMPGERYQYLLAHVYARTPAGTVALGPGSDLDKLLHALADLGVPTQRVGELRAMIVSTQTDDGAGLLAFLAPTSWASIAAALTDPQRLDDRVLHDLRSAIHDVNRHIGTLPFVRLQLMLAPVVEACRRLTGQPPPEPIRTGLTVVAADAYTLAGRLAFETRDDAASNALYAAAVHAVGKLPDTWRRAAVRTSHTMVTLYSTSNLTAARSVADAAVHDAQASTSLRIRARAYALQAELAARSAQPRHAAAALRLVWHALHGDTVDDPAPGSFDAGHLQGFEGVCQLHIGDPARAHDELDRSAGTLITPRDQVQRGIVTTDLALVRLRMGAPEAAAALLHDCIDLTAATGGRVPAQRIRQARLELAPWRAESFVADLDEHLHTAVLAPL